MDKADAVQLLVLHVVAVGLVATNPGWRRRAIDARRWVGFLGGELEGNPSGTARREALRKCYHGEIICRGAEPLFSKDARATHASSTHASHACVLSQRLRLVTTLVSLALRQSELIRILRY